MIVLIPEMKRIANIAKHGIDSADFAATFEWNHYVVLPAKPSRTGRARELYVGMMQDRLVTAVVSPLGSEALAVISVRPAATKEREAYVAKD